MRIIIFVFGVILFCVLPIYSQTLSGQVSENWTIEKARQEAFKHVPQNIDFTKYAPQNSFHYQVLEAKKNKISHISNCEIEFFDDDTYAIRENESLEGLYYDENGNLTGLHFENGHSYPKITYKYLYPDGYLIGVSISIRKGDNYVFSYDGEFVIHWVGDVGYGPDGKVKMRRKTIEEDEF